MRRKPEALVAFCGLRSTDKLRAGPGNGSALPCLGTVTAVDEGTAFSWPVCDRCGSERLKQSPEDR